MSSASPVIAFVSAPGGSAFMAEILQAVADAVSEHGAATICHQGALEDVADEGTAFVVVPHEYFALSGQTHPALLARTIGFGVEHLGTDTFEASARHAARLGGWFEIDDESAAEMRRRGRSCDRFTLGYVPRWDHWNRHDSRRNVDLTYLATADEHRLRTLSGFAVELAPFRTNLLIPPHEQMTVSRPNFLLAEDKWRSLADSRLLINLHRAGKTAFEWVRALEAICNGCVVLTEPSSGFAPLVPGEHLLVARASRMAAVAAGALREPGLLDRIARTAYDFAREQLTMQASAALLLDRAADLCRRTLAPRPRVDARTSDEVTDPPMAEWVPVTRRLPVVGDATDPRAAELLRQLQLTRLRYNRVTVGPHQQSADRPVVDVLCVRRHGDGSAQLSLTSLKQQSVDLVIHHGVDGAPPRDVSSPSGGPECACWVGQEPIGRGRVRNQLLEHGVAPYILVLDSGDELIGDHLADWVRALDKEHDTQIAYPMAVSGPEMVVNVLPPEVRRLDQFAYLAQGYLVRRTWLERIGGFTEADELESLVDHDFWLRSTRIGGRAVLLRQLGVRLAKKYPDVSLGDLDPVAAIRRLAATSSLNGYVYPRTGRGGETITH